MITKCSRRLFTPTLLGTLLLGLLAAPPAGLAADDPLPQAPLPLGRPDLVETRTVKELRPGLTHVRVTRGSWAPEGPPKWQITSLPLSDKAQIAELCGVMERAGLKPREHRFSLTLNDAPQHCMLLAGAFETRDEARNALTKLPNTELFRVTSPAALPTWEDGPWSFDIVVLDPKHYRGQIISARGLNRVSPLVLAKERGAVVATNGSFFEFSLDEFGGVPSGISIMEGEWRHEWQPPEHRAPIVFWENDPVNGPKLWIDHEAPPFPELQWEGHEAVPLNGIDRSPRGDDIVAMRTDVVGTSPFSHGIPAHITALQISSEGYLVPRSTGFLPEGGPILLATGEGRTTLEKIRKSGQRVTLDLRVPGRPGLNAMYGTSVLIHNGQQVSDLQVVSPDTPPARAYGFYRSYARRTGRTVIGADAQGKIYLVTTTTDGLHPPSTEGTPGVSIGIGLGELRAVAAHLQLFNAINLDGGGSTSMTIDGQVAPGTIDVQLRNGHGIARPVGDSVLIIDSE